VPVASFGKKLENENAQKIAIVTGASQVIGVAILQAILKRGYRVVANSRNMAGAKPLPGVGGSANPRVPFHPSLRSSRLISS